MQRVAWGLVTCAVLVLVAALIRRASLQDAVTIPTLMAVIAGLFFVQAHHRDEVEQQRSKFYLDSCVLAYERAWELLKDGNNDRANWIEAGRAAVSAMDLAKNVKIGEHKKVLDVHQVKYRRFFHEAIAAKHFVFFMGVKPTHETEEEEAFKYASPNQLRNTDGSTPRSRWLSEKSLYGIWLAAQWPDWTDPLEKTFSDEEIESTMVLFPGLYNYLTHLRRAK